VGAIGGGCGAGWNRFTMSLFIAGEAFRSEVDFEAAKIAVFIASGLSAVVGVTLLVLAAVRVPAMMRPLQDGDETAR
jgi:Na+:H+ antiporter, NhaA family